MGCKSRCGFFSGIFFFLFFHCTLRLFHTADCKKEVKRLKEVERLSKVSPTNRAFILKCKAHRMLMESSSHLTPNQPPKM